MKKWSFGRKAESGEVANGEQINLQMPRNAYYDNVSNVYHSLFLILMAALLVFVVVAMLCNVELFTYENFYYLAKDLSAAADLLSGSGNVINYETSARNQTFALYRGGLAVGGDSGLQLFTATGRETLNTSPEYTKPVLLGSDKYLMVYDIGEKRYSIYNSFVCVHHEETEYPVFAGAMSDSGYFAVVTESYSHKGVVCLYNDRFQMIARYSQNDRVVCTSLNQAGDRIVFATAGMRNGSYVTTLVIGTPGQEQTQKLEIEGFFPYSIEFVDQYRVLLVGDNACYWFYVADIVNAYAYDKKECPVGEKLLYADVSNQYGVLVYSVNPVTDTYRIVISDNNGNWLMDETYNVNLGQIEVYEEYVFLLTGSGVARIHPADRTHSLIECDTKGKRMLICDGGEVLVCGGQSAIYYEFED